MTEAFWTGVVAGVVAAIPIITGQVLTYLGSQRQRTQIAERSDVKFEGLTQQGNANHETLKEVAHNVDGAKTAIETVAGKLSTELMRVQETGVTTPTGIPDAANPVTLNKQGVPITDPDKPEPHHNGGV